MSDVKFLLLIVSEIDSLELMLQGLSLGVPRVLAAGSILGIQGGIRVLGEGALAEVGFWICCPVSFRDRDG